MRTPLTAALQYTSEGRRRLWTWYVRIGVLDPERVACAPGWIPERQRQACAVDTAIREAAEAAVRGLPIDADAVPLRCRRGVVLGRIDERIRGYYNRSIDPRGKWIQGSPWVELCFVAKLRNIARYGPRTKGGDQQ